MAMDTEVDGKGTGWMAMGTEMDGQWVRRWMGNGYGDGWAMGTGDGWAMGTEMDGQWVRRWMAMCTEIDGNVYGDGWQCVQR